MLKEEIVEYCAPTLAGIKTANLFGVAGGLDEIAEEIKKLNQTFIKKGLRVIPVNCSNRKTLIYIYRPERLKADLEKKIASDILKDKGYSSLKPECCVVQLAKRLSRNKDFPHEVGLFLGYPPADVKSFMDNPCDGVKCTGCWKAYSDEKEAIKTFEKYKKCTSVYKNEIKKGKSLESLIVDTRNQNDYQVAI
ncbi:MAG: DUF3793 family protein [Lachnospiraceae bacterium]|nr:DUF3793 family protein [Lachnospiraceae bacterium]